MNEINLSTEKNSSISLSRTSKGIYSWDIKIYYDDGETGGEKIIEKIKSLNIKMQKEFSSDIKEKEE